MFISIVIPNYNGSELLKRNLPKLLSLLEKSKLEYEVIVVDDASGDESEEVIKGLPVYRSTGLQLIKKAKNEGFPSTADRGIRAAKGEIVFVIKNDAVPEKADYFSLILEHFKDQEVFAVGAAQRTIEKGKEEIRGCGVIYFERGLFKHKRGLPDYRSTGLPMLSAWPDGSASAYRRDIYLKLGGFDPLYNPGYWEDVDLGYRAWKADYRVEFEPKAILLHDYEQSVFKKKYGAEKLHLINLRNQFIFTWKNADLGHLLDFYFWETYNHLASLKRGDRDFVNAYWQAMLKWPEILKCRLFQRRIDKLSDNKALKIFENIT